MADDRNQILVAVGDALENWSRVEIHLTNLFSTLSDLQDKRDIQINRKAHAIFDTIVSFETRLQVIDTPMAEERLSELDLETWARCSARLNKFYKKTA
jgi:hypothetical protein